MTGPAWMPASAGMTNYDTASRGGGKNGVRMVLGIFSGAEKMEEKVLRISVGGNPIGMGGLEEIFLQAEPSGVRAKVAPWP